jgi:response regulator RpfG family c-di-GMP phosphodiesterase
MEQIHKADLMQNLNHIDAILLDVNLGQENGIELCKKLRENQLTQKIPIMIMTGFGDREKLKAQFPILVHPIDKTDNYIKYQ